jgi:hypothetical protein
MTGDPMRALDPVVRALSREIMQAPDWQINRIVALVDAMPVRGDADHLLAPLRHRLALLKPPRPLRLARLIFHPLKPLIIPASSWRPGQHAVPRTVILPMAGQVRLAMGAAGIAIETSMAGQTTADTALMTGLGRGLWSEAAKILTESSAPENWSDTALAAAAYRPLADLVAAVLAHATELHTLCAESATGLLPPRPELLAAILDGISRTNPAILPMVIAILLESVPQVAGLLSQPPSGTRTTASRIAIDQGVTLLLQRIGPRHSTEARIINATLSDAAAETRRIMILLACLADSRPVRPGQLRDIRQGLSAGCLARFTSGLRHELLAPLQALAGSADPACVVTLETTARHLRVLAIEARILGNGLVYDQLLDQAVKAIKDDAMRDTMPLPDRIRLIEILAGPDSALAMLSITG